MYNFYEKLIKYIIHNSFLFSFQNVKQIVTSCHEDKDYDRAMRKYVFGHMRTVRVLIGLRGRAVRSGPSLSANRILGYNRMYEWRVDFPVILCAWAGWSEFVYFAHVRRNFFA